VTDVNVSNRSAAALAQSIRTAALSTVWSRRGLIGIAVLLLALGLAFNWSSLIAVGAAPLILAVLPCTVMCAFGLCMAHGNHHSDSPSTRSNRAAATESGEADSSCCSPAKARSK
jgi:hypothetical protein